VDVPSAIAATRLTNAHAKNEQLVILLTNFVFITIYFLFLFRPSLTLVIELSFLAVTGACLDKAGAIHPERVGNIQWGWGLGPD
jgi:hypothetical protein